jgi:hypothetical protein
LSEIDVELSREYWESVYSGTFTFTRCSPENEIKARLAELVLLVNLYKLGCSLELNDVQLRNMATLELSKSLQACNILPNQKLLAVVWSITPRGDGLRKLLLDFTVARGGREDIGEWLARYPSAFVHDLALAALDKAPMSAWQSAATNSARYLELEEAEANT